MFTSDYIAKEPNMALVSLELKTILKNSEITWAEDSGTIKEWLICFSVASMQLRILTRMSIHLSQETNCPLDLSSYLN